MVIMTPSGDIGQGDVILRYRWSAPVAESIETSRTAAVTKSNHGRAASSAPLAIYGS